MSAYLKIIIFIVICFGVPATAYSQVDSQAAPVFFSNITDVPVMSGLYELADESIFFDQPDGRIVAAVAASEDVDIKDMSVFYARALPNFGWVRQSDDSFLRGNERLKIQFETQGIVNLVHVSVMPAH